MDNNQQDITPAQPSEKPTVNSVTAPGGYAGTGITNLGVNEPKTMTGNSVQSPLTSENVSMTTAQPYGGPIVTTEAEPSVRTEAGPY